jgi:hypothetical protein
VLAPTPLFSAVAPGYASGTLTRDGADTYQLDAANGTLTTRAAATNSGSNSRGVFWPVAQVPIAKQQTCATFAARSGRVVQLGLALRIKQTKAGAVRAITVTSNVYLSNPVTGYGTWRFNVHTWNTKRNPPFQQVGSFDLKDVFSSQDTALPYPWRLCARVQGRLLMFEAWRPGEPTPAWTSTTNGGSMKLPLGTGYAGQAGWYIGHLYANDSGSVRALSAGVPTTAPA